MEEKRAMLIELETGLQRPMRRTAPVRSSVANDWEGVLFEEHPPAEWASTHVSLLSNTIHLAINDPFELEWRANGKTVSRRIQPGEISVLPANHPYSARLRSAGGSVVVSLEQELLSCAAAEIGATGDLEPVWIHGENDALLRELVLALREEVGEPEQSNRRYAQSLAFAMAAHVVQRYSSDRLCIEDNPRGLTMASLRRAAQFIHERLGEEIPVDRIAAELDFSTAHFARMFKLSTGLSPHQYVMQCRVRHAKQLLMNKRNSLAEVASQAGFCDQAHMNRTFRQFVGTTPGAYMRRLFRSVAS